MRGMAKGTDSLARRFSNGVRSVDVRVSDNEMSYTLEVSQWALPITVRGMTGTTDNCDGFLEGPCQIIMAVLEYMYVFSWTV